MFIVLFGNSQKDYEQIYWNRIVLLEHATLAFPLPYTWHKSSTIVLNLIFRVQTNFFPKFSKSQNIVLVNFVYCSHSLAFNNAILWNICRNMFPFASAGRLSDWLAIFGICVSWNQYVFIDSYCNTVHIIIDINLAYSKSHSSCCIWIWICYKVIYWIYLTSIELLAHIIIFRFFFIVFTDLSCWAPIIVTKILALYTYDISSKW